MMEVKWKPLYNIMGYVICPRLKYYDQHVNVLSIWQPNFEKGNYWYRGVQPNFR
jgi:hypothetical protein